MSERAAIKVRAPRVRTPRPPPVLRAGQRHGAIGVRTSGPEGRAVLQPKLRVGRADDPLEREAETQAARIVAMPAPDLALPPRAGGAAPPGQPARRAAAPDQPDLDTLETAPPLPADHEEPTVAPAEDVDPTALDTADLAELESGSPKDTGGAAPAPQAPPPPEAGEAQPARAGDGAHKPAVGPEGGLAPPDVSARVARPGPGRPLPPTVRAFMEPRFGVDLADVRLHDSAEDRRAAARIGARAFTLREHIWLGHGEAADDRRLIAHELTHVIQQTGRRDPPAARAPVGGGAAAPVIRRLFDLAAEAENYARQIPGYTLLTVILGKSPLTDERVPRTAENLIGGFLGLLPGGTVLFDRLQESRALEQAFEWVSSRLADLDITWPRIAGLIERVWKIFPTLSPLREIRAIFAPLVEDILTFAGEIKDKILEFIVRGALKLAGPLAEKVWGVIQNAGDTLSLILSDPLTFAKNLVLGVLKGYGQFALNILEHLKRGLLGWLFGALQGAELQLPEKLDFKGLISIVLQILGLTYDSFRKKLVKQLGASGEKMVSFLEKSVEVVKLLATEGFLGIWQKMLSLIDDFKSTVIGGIRDLVITSIVRAGLSWLAGLSNPVGAVIKVVLAIYDMIVVFLERIDQILEVANAVFAAIGTMARGNIQQAADAVENAIGRNVPVVISFLAGLIGLTGISTKIRNVIKKLRKPIDKAIKKLLGFIVKKAKKLFSKLIAKLNSKRKLPSANFTIGKAQHRIFARKKGRKAEIVIASGTPQTLDQIEQCVAAELKKLKDAGARREAAELDTATAAAAKDSKDEITTIDLESENKTMRGVLTSLAREINEAADDYNKKGKDTDQQPELNTAVEKCLFRAREPRDAKIEGYTGGVGKQMSHKNVKELTSQKLSKDSKLTWSTFYESDHMIEKQFPQFILINLQAIDPRASTETRSWKHVLRLADERKQSKTKIEKKQQGAQSFGLIGSKAEGFASIDAEGDKLPTMAIYKGIHDAKATPTIKPETLMIEAAREEDPHGWLRNKLREQLALEMASIRKLYAKDKSASPEIRQSIETGLAALSARNSAIYGFDRPDEQQVAAQDVSAPEEEQSNATFAPREGETNRPDFRAIEGKGGPYANADAAKKEFGSFGRWINYDHLIEKNFPPTAARFRFDAKGIKERIAAKAAAPGPDAIRRPDALDGAPLFPETSPLRDYSEDTGYAIPIYRPIHDLVRGDYAVASPGAVLKSLPEEFVTRAAEVLQAGDDTTAENALRSARESATRHFRTKFHERFAEHGKRLADGYAAEIPKVVALNPNYPDQARKAMATVAGNVAASLREAENKTLGLFL